MFCHHTNPVEIVLSSNKTCEKRVCHHTNPVEKRCVIIQTLWKNGLTSDKTCEKQSVIRPKSIIDWKDYYKTLLLYTHSQGVAT
jgi:hypothetical protein